MGDGEVANIARPNTYSQRRIFFESHHCIAKSISGRKGPQENDRKRLHEHTSNEAPAAVAADPGASATVDPAAPVPAAPEVPAALAAAAAAPAAVDPAASVPAAPDA